ncbi:MAG TPA: hypothetical protein VFE02_13325 [Candidatus Acidoferrales bacterium]|jgi:hypothetical protein|nr:hypothetical protein [Candidatus Acidoferrales bacterium]
MKNDTMNLFRGGVFVAICALFVALFVQVPTASAIPSYARQTGFPCKSCHYMPPELTPLGRAFKLNGYTMSGKPTVTSPAKGNVSGLNILETFPLSVLLDTSFTSLKSPEPLSQNGSFQLPQQASLFLAGAWSTHVGSFIQVTYTSQDDHFTWDNSDIRYANATHLLKKDLAYGITLNNNPTVEDLWNSTPAWGFPWVGSDWAPGPTAGALINGGLGSDVAGIGMYAMWDNHLYIDGTIYRSAHIGVPQPNTGNGLGINIRGVAPYWRVAWQQNSTNNNLEIGTYGMHLKSTPGGITGLEDAYTDWAGDFQYDHIFPQFHGDVLSIRGTYIRENSALLNTFTGGGADIVQHHLNTIQANAEYHFGDKYSATIGYFNVDGTPDFSLYSGAATPGDVTTVPPVTGSVNGDPRSNGFIANLSWWPVQNIGLSAQYTAYTRFNGGNTNYDNNGRNASSNNTIYLVARFVF